MIHGYCFPRGYKSFDAYCVSYGLQLKITAKSLSTYPHTLTTPVNVKSFFIYICR
jgi:hypothetical protein